jgi:hypothetical protein
MFIVGRIDLAKVDAAASSGEVHFRGKLPTRATARMSISLDPIGWLHWISLLLVLHLDFHAFSRSPSYAEVCRALQRCFQI